jgi:hypothetical protein
MNVNWDAVRDAQRIAQRTGNAEHRGVDSSGEEMRPGEVVYVKGWVGTAKAHDPSDTVVVFEDAKGSHFQIEFHPEALNP